MWLKTQSGDLINLEKISSISESDNIITAIESDLGSEIELAKFPDTRRTTFAMQEIYQAFKDGKKFIDLSNN